MVVAKSNKPKKIKLTSGSLLFGLAMLALPWLRIMLLIEPLSLENDDPQYWHNNPLMNPKQQHAKQQVVANSTYDFTSKMKNTGPKYESQDVAAKAQSIITATSLGLKSIPPSQMETHYHELWNHTTSTIELPEEYQNPFDILYVDDNSKDPAHPDYRRPLTSLEILQSVLHNAKYQTEFEAVEKYMNSNDPTTVAPKCLLPDVEATQTLAKNVVEFRNRQLERKAKERKERRKAKRQQQQKQQQESSPRRRLTERKTKIVPWQAPWPYERLSLPLPILNMGYPKVGSTSLRDYLQCIGLNADHGQNGERWFQNLHRKARLHARNTTWDYKSHSYTQLDSNFGPGYYPQISLLDEIHEKDPNATFLFNFRPVKDWIRSVTGWNNMDERFMGFSIPGLQNTPEQRQLIEAKAKAIEAGTDFEPLIPLRDVQIAKWWCGHVLHLREFVKEYPSHALIELDLYDQEGTASLLYDLFQKDMDLYKKAVRHKGELPSNCWGQSNASKEHQKRLSAEKKKNSEG